TDLLKAQEMLNKVDQPPEEKTMNGNSKLKKQVAPDLTTMKEFAQLRVSPRMESSALEKMDLDKYDNGKSKSSKKNEKNRENISTGNARESLPLPLSSRSSPAKKKLEKSSNLERYKKRGSIDINIVKDETSNESVLTSHGNALNPEKRRVNFTRTIHTVESDTCHKEEQSKEQTNIIPILSVSNNRNCESEFGFFYKFIIIIISLFFFLVVEKMGGCSARKRKRILLHIFFFNSLNKTEMAMNNDGNNPNVNACDNPKGDRDASQQQQMTQSYYPDHCSPELLRTYEVVVQAKVREQKQLDSLHITDLPEGTIVIVAEIDGTRARIIIPIPGWLSIQSKFGAKILQPVCLFFLYIVSKYLIER
ncbi:hypothetical protein RFI_25291, partial [Reticulomyxa filosa]